MPVNLQRPTSVTRNVRTVSASATFDLVTDDILLVNANAANAAITVPQPVATHDRIVTVKRIDNNPQFYVYVQSVAGIDNDDTHVSLNPTVQGGVNSGESVDMVWDDAADEWRVLGSLQNTQTLDTQTNLLWEGTRTVTGNFSVNWTGRCMVIGKGYDPGGAIDQFIAMTMPAVGTLIPISSGGTRAVTANGIQLNSWESLYYRANPNAGNANNAGGEGYIIVPYNDNYRDNELAVWLATHVSANVRLVWGDYQIGSDPAAASDFWRTPNNAGALPDGTTDVADNIFHQGRVGIGQNPMFTSGPVAWLDLASVSRSGVDGRVAGTTPLYITGDVPPLAGASLVGATPAGGFEFRHTNQTQGIGISYNGLYACGSNADQSIGIMQKGAGQIDLKWQALLGAFNHLNYAGPALVGPNDGFYQRWYAAGTQIAGDFVRKSTFGVGGTAGFERIWNLRDSQGTFRNAMSLFPSATHPDTFTLSLDPNSLVNDKKLVLWESPIGAAVQGQFFGLGIRSGEFTSWVGSAPNFFRWRHSLAGTLALSLSGGGILTIDPANTSPGIGGAAIRFGSETSGVQIATKRTGAADRFSDDLEFATSSIRRFAILNTGRVYMNNVPTFASDAAAGAGGLQVGEIYKSAAGVLSIKL